MTHVGIFPLKLLSTQDLSKAGPNSYSLISHSLPRPATVLHRMDFAPEPSCLPAWAPGVFPTQHKVQPGANGQLIQMIHPHLSFYVSYLAT